MEERKTRQVWLFAALRDKAAAQLRFPDCREQVSTQAWLQDIAEGAGCQGRAAGIGVFVDGKKDNFGVWLGYEQAFCRLDPVEDRHGNIENHNIGAQFQGGVESSLTITDGGDHVAIGRQESTDVFKHLLVVVGYQYTNFGHGNICFDHSTKTRTVGKILGNSESRQARGRQSPRLTGEATSGAPNKDILPMLR